MYCITLQVWFKNCYNNRSAKSTSSHYLPSKHHSTNTLRSQLATICFSFSLITHQAVIHATQRYDEGRLLQKIKRNSKSKAKLFKQKEYFTVITSLKNINAIRKFESLRRFMFLRQSRYISNIKYVGTERWQSPCRESVPQRSPSEFCQLKTRDPSQLFSFFNLNVFSSQKLYSPSWELVF